MKGMEISLPRNTITDISSQTGVTPDSSHYQLLMASLLCLSGRYGDLLDMISFVVVIFYVLTILGIFILRKKRPNAERPYKAFGYPFLPALYILMGISFCLLLIKYKPQYTWPGLIIVLIGIPIYFVALARKKN